MLNAKMKKSTRVFFGGEIVAKSLRAFNNVQLNFFLIKLTTLQKKKILKLARRLARMANVYELSLALSGKLPSRKRRLHKSSSAFLHLIVSL